MGTLSQPFEYISILVSIILGLGITQLIASATDLICQSRPVRMYWPQTAWVVFIAFLLIQDWFITYRLRDLSIWRLPALVFILLYPALLFIASKLVLPAGNESAPDGMKEFYFSHFRKLFLVMSITAMVSVIFNLLWLGRPLIEQGILAIFCAILAWMSLGNIRIEVLHKSLALALLLGMLLSVILQFDEWVIR